MLWKRELSMVNIRKLTKLIQDLVQQPEKYVSSNNKRPGSSTLTARASVASSMSAGTVSSAGRNGSSLARPPGLHAALHANQRAQGSSSSSSSSSWDTNFSDDEAPQSLDSSTNGGGQSISERADFIMSQLSGGKPQGGSADRQDTWKGQMAWGEQRSAGGRTLPGEPPTAQAARKLPAPPIQQLGDPQHVQKIATSLSLPVAAEKWQSEEEYLSIDDENLPSREAILAFTQRFSSERETAEQQSPSSTSASQKNLQNGWPPPVNRPHPGSQMDHPRSTMGTGYPCLPVPPAASLPSSPRPLCPRPQPDENHGRQPVARNSSPQPSLDALLPISSRPLPPQPPSEEQHYECVENRDSLPATEAMAALARVLNSQNSSSRETPDQRSSSSTLAFSSRPLPPQPPCGEQSYESVEGACSALEDIDNSYEYEYESIKHNSKEVCMEPPSGTDYYLQPVASEPARPPLPPKPVTSLAAPPLEPPSPPSRQMEDLGSTSSSPGNSGDGVAGRFGELFRKVRNKPVTSMGTVEKEKTSAGDGKKPSLLQNQRPLPPTPEPGKPLTTSTKDQSGARRGSRPTSVTNMPWFHNVDRARADQLLRNTQDGTFLLRPSSQTQNPLSLTLWYNNRIYNISVRYRPDGRYSLGYEKPNEQSFASVEELVANHQSENLVLYSNGERTGRTLLTGWPPRRD
ncbi:B-cell linker protein-like isoform X2 [Bacillus rossius redtenbacheri]